MNTMEITKVVGGLSASLLILLLLKFGAEAYYFPAEHHEGEAAYTIAVADEGPAEEVEVIPFSEVLASADAGKGARVFNKCAACHSAEAGITKVGPTLFGVVDRAQGGEEFAYSAAITDLGGTWTVDALNEFLIKPSDYAPSTAMNFAGLPKENDRANLVAYLATLQ